MDKDDQVLKSRDDKTPVTFSTSSDGAADGRPFKLAEDSDCSWAEKDEAFGPDILRPRIEPWLTALFQSEHLALLVGSGLSQAVFSLARGAALPGMATVGFPHYNDEISAAAKRSAAAADREEGNFEDQLRVANELLRGLAILAETEKGLEKKRDELREDLKGVLEGFADSVLQGENGLITSDPDKLENASNYLVSFLISFASRTGTRDRLQVFTTNYDRFIEAGAELAGLHLLDRFVGSLAPIFRSSRLDVDMHYNPPGIRGEPRYLEGVAKFTKLHGSLDWVSSERSIRRIGLPFGAFNIKPFLNAPGLHGVDALQLMIYPNSAKDRETAVYPYVELFRDFAAAVCRPNSTLVTFGYGFGDEHVNRVIEDMLTIPSAHLVVVSYSDPLGRIMNMYQRVGRHAQITLMVGDHLGDLRTLVENYLPKPAIDRTSFRMAELLKSRWTGGRSEPASEGEVRDSGEGGET